MSTSKTEIANSCHMKWSESKSLALVLYRSPRLLAGLILEIVLSLALLTYRLVQFGNDPLLYLQMSQSVCTLSFLFTAFVAYEYIFSLRKSGIEEVVVTQSKTRFSLYGTAFLVLLAPVFLNFFLGFIFPTCSALSQGLPSAFLLHIFLVTFLDSFLAGLIAVCLGVFCGLCLERIKGYSVIALFFFLMISASDLIPGILNDGYNVNVWPIKALFSDILLPDQDWTIDYQYGLQIEPYRWNCILFWIFLFWALISRKITAHSSKLRLPIAGICIALSLTNLWGFINSGSKIDLSEAPNSVFRTDQVYYNKEYPREERADFQVSAYDMSIRINRKLEASISMEVTPLTSSDVYRFTLYRTYKINRVFDDNGKDLSFSQSGDYFTVTPDSDVKTINVEYEGYSPMFYSNKQGVCLPGSFPYYPWAGYKQIYYATPDAEAGLVSFIPRTDLPETSYSVKVAGNYPIYSNLGPVRSEESVHGTASTFSLVGGMLDQQKSKGYNMVTTWAQPNFINFSPDYLDVLQKAVTDLEAEKGYEDHIDLQNYLLFEMNETMLNRCGYGLAVAFDDHIFLSAYPDVKGVAQAITCFIHEGPPLSQEKKLQLEGASSW